MFRLVAAVGLVALASGVSAQSLGDAAARERERREQVHGHGSPARVITADDLATTNGRIANDPTIAPAAMPPPAIPGLVAMGSVEAERAKRERREAHWRQEARRRRDELALAEEEVQRAERWSVPTYAGKDQPWCPITRRSEQKKARAELARARLSLQALEEEARVAHALPGWIR